MLLCKNLTKTWNGQGGMTDVNLRIEPKECVCIVGPAQSGKTTLFHLLLKAEDPTSGSIEIDGIPLDHLPPLVLQLYRTRLGIIFQEPHLLQHATVRENIAYPLELRGAPEAVIEERTRTLLKRFNLTAKVDAFPDHLSLSERALVGIMRACISSPVIILADEPLQCLDEDQAQSALALLQEANRRGCTIVVFTSNASLAQALGARTLRLHDGKITEEDRPKDLGRGVKQHGILEAQDDIPLSDLSAVPPATPPPAPDKRKIKITSINA